MYIPALKIPLFMALPLVTALFSACSPSYNFYFRNLRDENVQVTMKFSSSDDLDYWMYDKTYHWRGNRTLLPTRHKLEGNKDYNNKSSLLTDSIEVKKLDTLTVLFSLPPHSLVAFGRNEVYRCAELKLVTGDYNKTISFSAHRLNLFDNRAARDENISDLMYTTRNGSLSNIFFDIND